MRLTEALIYICADDIPTATNTNAYCTLSIIKAGYAHAPAEVFLKDVPPNSFLDMPDYCFLIEKTINGSTRRFLFDLGLRKDGTPLSAQFAERRRILNFESPQGVDETLKANGVSLASLEGVIFSHTHWEYVLLLVAFHANVALTFSPRL